MFNSISARKSNKYRFILYYLIMFSFTGVICFVLLEYVIAKFYYSNVGQVSYKEFDSELGWLNKPGRYFIKPTHAFNKVPLYINKYGLRNKDIILDKKNNNKRIIVLGDSFTFSNAIPEEYIFTSQLEKTLNQDSTEKYTIINAGVEGYGNIQELLLMRRLAGNEIKGDIYLLMIFINDILDDLCLSYGDATENLIQPKYILGKDNKLFLSRSPQKQLSESGNLIPVRKNENKFVTIETMKIKFASFAQAKPQIIYILNKLGFNIKFPRVPGLISGWFDNNILNKGLPIMRESIKEIKEEAEKNQASLYVCLIPSPLQVYPDTYGPLLKKTFPNDKQVESWLNNKLIPQEFIKKICDELEIPFLDLLPILYENNNKDYFIPMEGHFNERGHSIVGSSLAKFIIQSKK